MTGMAVLLWMAFLVRYETKWLPNAVPRFLFRELASPMDSKAVAGQSLEPDFRSVRRGWADSLSIASGSPEPATGRTTDRWSRDDVQYCIIADRDIIFRIVLKSIGRDRRRYFVHEKRVFDYKKRATRAARWPPVRSRPNRTLLI